MAQSVPISGASQALITAAVRYNGFSLCETSGTASAKVRLWDNAAAAAGSLLDVVTLTAGESAREHYPDSGIEAASGIFVQVVSGAVEGAIRVGG